MYYRGKSFSHTTPIEIPLLTVIFYRKLRFCRKYIAAQNHQINSRFIQAGEDLSRLFRMSHANPRLPGDFFLG